MLFAKAMLDPYASVSILIFVKLLCFYYILVNMLHTTSSFLKQLAIDLFYKIVISSSFFLAGCFTWTPDGFKLVCWGT